MSFRSVIGLVSRGYVKRCFSHSHIGSDADTIMHLKAKLKLVRQDNLKLIAVNSELREIIRMQNADLLRAPTMSSKEIFARAYIYSQEPDYPSDVTEETFADTAVKGDYVRGICCGKLGSATYCRNLGIKCENNS